MKRITVFLTALVMIACLGSVAYAASERINMKITVDPYIAVNPTYENWDVDFGHLNPGAAPPNPAEISASTGWVEVAYANIPFKVTLSGSNGAGDIGPIFARQEKDANGNPIPMGWGRTRWDRLSTHLSFTYRTNYERRMLPLPLHYEWEPGADASEKTIAYDSLGILPGFWSSPLTIWHSLSYGSATLNLPHNGDILMQISTETAQKGKTRLPHTTPDWPNSPNPYKLNDWFDSADAGEYTCYVIATYTSL